MNSANQVHCSGKTARKGQRYITKKRLEFTGKGELFTAKVDNSSRPQKERPIELITLIKT